MTCTFDYILFQLLRECSPLPKTPYPASLLGRPVFCFAYTIDWSRIKWVRSRHSFRLSAARACVCVGMWEKKGLEVNLELLLCSRLCVLVYLKDKEGKTQLSCLLQQPQQWPLHRVGQCFLELLIYLLCFPQSSDRQTQLTLTATFFLIQTPSPFSFAT